ncbi:uncharacterized protein PHA67_021093 isoform 1-T1 [Liasis olivaceus]
MDPGPPGMDFSACQARLKGAREGGRGAKSPEEAGRDRRSSSGRRSRKRNQSPPGVRAFEGRPPPGEKPLAEMSACLEQAHLVPLNGGEQQDQLLPGLSILRLPAGAKISIPPGARCVQLLFGNSGAAAIAIFRLNQSSGGTA